jgi:cytochrome c553
MRIGRYAACLTLALAASAFAQETQQSGFEDPAGAAAAAGAAGAKPAPARPGTVETGAAKAAACAACHGMDGNSSDAQYPKIAGQHERYIARQLSLFKSGERENPVMLGFATTLSEQDMRDIGAYFASKQALPGVADDSKLGDTEETYAQRGERLYRGGSKDHGQPACMACHGPTGRGNPGPPFPSLAGQHSNYTKDLLKRFRSGQSFGKDDRANTVMTQVAASLSDQDIEALASYIEGLHRAGGGETKVAGK